MPRYMYVFLCPSVCVCLCGGGGVGAAGVAAVSNGSCLTGPWEIELKRSIRYNVNNDPSSHCAAQDKSIKDPSRPVIAILCQRLAESAAAEGGAGEWMLKHKTIFKSAQQNSTRIVIKMSPHIQWWAISLAVSFFVSFIPLTLACSCWLFAMVDLQLNGIRLELEWSPCRLIDYPLTKQYWQTHSDASEIISEKGVFNDTSCEKHAGGCLLKRASFEDNRGVLFTGSLSFFIQGAIARK